MNRADAFLLLYLVHCVASSDSQLTHKCTRYDSHFYMYIKSTKNVTSEIESEIKKLIENFETISKSKLQRYRWYFNTTWNCRISN